MEPELTDQRLLCTPSGDLDRAAVGWSRRPLHRCNLRGHWGRKKRWDYWCVTSDDCVLSVTYADCDYLGLASVLFLDLATGRCLDKGLMIPLALGFAQPETVAGGDLALDALGLHFRQREEPAATQLEVGFAKRGVRLRGEVAIAMPPGHQTLSVVVPWSDRQFQFTSKHNTRPATGTVTVDLAPHAPESNHRCSPHPRTTQYRFGPDNHAFGCLDFGRGVWPYRTEWNWGSSSGVSEGHTIGLQFGAKWTAGTGMTENGLCIDGVLHKIGEDVEFRYDRRDFTRPWHLTTRSGRVDLEFLPCYEKRIRFDLGLLASNLHLCFGHFSGQVRSGDDRRYAVERQVGWCEEMRARW